MGSWTQAGVSVLPVHMGLQVQRQESGELQIGSLQNPTHGQHSWPPLRVDSNFFVTNLFRFFVWSCLQYVSDYKIASGWVTIKIIRKIWVLYLTNIYLLKAALCPISVLCTYFIYLTVVLYHASKIVTSRRVTWCWFIFSNQLDSLPHALGPIAFLPSSLLPFSLIKNKSVVLEVCFGWNNCDRRVYDCPSVGTMFKWLNFFTLSFVIWTLWIYFFFHQALEEQIGFTRWEFSCPQA